jgi:hypothetical protein
MRIALIAALSFAAMTPALLVPAVAQEGGGGMLERLKMADANKDGSITRAEMNAARAATFARMDRNGDGFITADERQQMADAAAAKGKGKGGAGRGDRGGAGADANNDGKVSREEFLASPMRGFDRLDANNNDIVEASEIENARAMLARRKQVTP